MPSGPNKAEFNQLVDSRGSRTYQLAVLFGISAGVVIIFVGVGLCIAGLSGSIEWILTAKGWSSKLANASPGIFFSLLGFLIVIWYKPKYQFRFSAHKTHQLGNATTPPQTVSKMQGSGRMSALPRPDDRSK